MVLELKDVVIDLDKKTIIDKINITIPKNKYELENDLIT